MAKRDTTIYTAAQVAAELCIGSRMIRRLATQRGLGKRLGDGTWVFYRADIEAMRVRAPRGPKPQQQKGEANERR